jgi:hypothetical protein
MLLLQGVDLWPMLFAAPLPQGCCSLCLCALPKAACGENGFFVLFVVNVGFVVAVTQEMLFFETSRLRAGCGVW